MAWETGFSQVDQYFPVQDSRNQKENIRTGGLKIVEIQKQKTEPVPWMK